MSQGIQNRLLGAQPDERLAALARRGHERAFEAVVHRYRRPLMRYCRRRLALPEARAEDVVQQALLNAWVALQRGVEVRELRPWLYRIAHNVAVNSMRSERPSADLDAAEHLDSIRGDVALAPSIEETMEVRDALASMAALPPMQREVMVRTAVAGHSHEEVASALGISDGAVRGLLYRARASIRTAAAAVVPSPLIAWAAGASAPSGVASERIAELAAGGGVAGLAGLAAKGGVAVITAGAIITGAALAPSHHSPAASRMPGHAPQRAVATGPAAHGAPPASDPAASDPAGSRPAGGGPPATGSRRADRRAHRLARRRADRRRVDSAVRRRRARRRTRARSRHPAAKAPRATELPGSSGSSVDAPAAAAPAPSAQAPSASDPRRRSSHRRRDRRGRAGVPVVGDLPSAPRAGGADGAARRQRQAPPGWHAGGEDGHPSADGSAPQPEGGESTQPQQQSQPAQQQEQQTPSDGTQGEAGSGGQEGGDAGGQEGGGLDGQEGGSGEPAGGGGGGAAQGSIAVQGGLSVHAGGITVRLGGDSVRAGRGTIWGGPGGGRAGGETVRGGPGGGRAGGGVVQGDAAGRRHGGDAAWAGGGRVVRGRWVPAGGAVPGGVEMRAPYAPGSGRAPSPAGIGR